VEAKEELDFLGADYLPDRFHGAFATRAFEGIAAPSLEDQVEPEGAHVEDG
jgi:hypothetical protein